MKVRGLLFLLFLFCSHNLWAQEQLKETTHRYEQEGSKLKITFSIDVKPYEEYIIRKVNVYSDNNLIEAKSVSGDVTGLISGEHVIFWDVMKDVNSLNKIGYIEIVMEYTPAAKKAVERIKTSEAKYRNAQKEEKPTTRVKTSSNSYSSKKRTKIRTRVWNRPYKRFRVGITAGIGGTFPAIPEEAYKDLLFEKDEASLDPIIDLNLGLTARYHFSKVFGITAEAAWQRTAFLFDAEYAVFASYNNGYTAELDLTYDKQVVVNSLRVPVMASIHLTSDFALLGGMYWDFIQAAKITGENSWGGDFYDANGNYIDNEYDYFDDDIDVYAVDEVEVGGISHYPFNKKLQGFVVGLELDGRNGSLRAIYSFTSNNLVNETYYENLEYGVTAEDVDLVYDLLPQMTDLNITTQQILLQYTLWF